jgi:hypothetical protein
MPTDQAQRVQKAQRIIAGAYGKRPSTRAIRFELLGGGVALAVVPDGTAGHVIVKVARALPNGRAQRMLKESRRGFATVREQIEYFESLYERYGGPR